MHKLILFISVIFSAPLYAEVKAVRDNKTMRVEIDGKLFTEFRSDQRVACMYPLLAMDGSHLTRRHPLEKGIEGEPTDHPHHVSFWVAHGSVNGIDFWHGGDASIRTKSLGDAVSTTPNKIRFSADLDWIGKGEKKILTETRNYAITSDGVSRIIDVTCEFKATDGDVVFGDTKEGMFAIRVAPTMQLKGEKAKGQITNSKGMTGDAAWGKRAKWVASHGPNLSGNETVIALMDHPSNLNFPTWWHARDYGLLAANPFGTSSFRDKDSTHGRGHKLESGDTLTQIYRVVIHEGDLASAKLDFRWEEFAKRN